MTIKTTVGIATLKEREESFKQTIASIYPQVDRIYAVLNNYDEIPEWITELKKVVAIVGRNNLGDAAKFLFVDICKGYYLPIDDDLIYPHDYAQKLRRAIDHYNCVCTFHGKRFSKHGTRNHRADYFLLMQCLKNAPCDTKLHLGGTGVMGFHTRDFHPTIGGFLTPNMADIWLAKQAHEAGVPIMGISHHKGWLKYIPPVDTPIWDREQDVEFQTGVINNFLKK